MPTKTARRHFVKPRCQFGCRFLQITDELWLCPHAAFGEASYKLGAVEEARRMMEKAGGYDKLLRALEAQEAEERREKRQKYLDAVERTQKAVRYDRAAGDRLVSP
jgi:hypothetical protein